MKKSAVLAPLQYLENTSAVGVKPDKEGAERLKQSGEYEKTYAEGTTEYSSKVVLHVLNLLCLSIKHANKELFDSYSLYMDLYFNTDKRVLV